jgi:hypothetical protein
LTKFGDDGGPPAISDNTTLLFAAFVLASPRASIVHHLDLIVVGADNSDVSATVSIVRRIWRHAPIASLLFDDVAHWLLKSPG